MNQVGAPLVRRTALVTGVSCALGEAIARKFLAQGSYVFGCSRTPPPSTEMGPVSVAERAGKFRFIPADLRSDVEVRSLADRIASSGETLNSIIHVAGGIPPLDDHPDRAPEAWLAAFDLNVLSFVRVVDYLAHTLPADSAPSIVVIGSTNAEEPGVRNPHYSAAKAALLNYSKHLASKLARNGIRVNYMSLGPVLSGNWAAADAENSTRLTQLKRLIPLGRLGSPDEVAEIVWHLDSPAFGWVTGSQIRVDGGKSLGL